MDSDATGDRGRREIPRVSSAPWMRASWPTDEAGWSTWRDARSRLFSSPGRVFAVDNRCPHMGFPLDRGTVKDCILTCHWHHARFDLASRRHLRSMGRRRAGVPGADRRRRHLGGCRGAWRSTSGVRWHDWATDSSAISRW